MVTALRRIQIGQESTPGTPVAADIILLGRLTLTPEITWHDPENEERNSLAMHHRLENVGQQASLTYEGALTFQQVIHLLAMGIGALITSQPDSGGSPTVYDHTFEPTLIALAAPKAYTVEYGDNQQEYECTFVMASQVEFSFAMEEVWQMSADLFGRFPTKSTFTGALTAPTVEDAVGQKCKVYIDSSWANLGNTQVASSLINATIRVPTGFGQTRYADGSLEASNFSELPRAAEVELTFKHDASGEAEYDNLVAGTTVFIRLEVEGSTAENAFNYTFRADFALKYTEPPELFGEQDGENVIRLAGKSFHDPTSGRDMRFMVRNTTATL